MFCYELKKWNLKHKNMGYHTTSIPIFWHFSFSSAVNFVPTILFTYKFLQHSNIVFKLIPFPLTSNSSILLLNPSTNSVSFWFTIPIYFSAIFLTRMFCSALCSSKIPRELMWNSLLKSISISFRDLHCNYENIENESAS